MDVLVTNRDSDDLALPAGASAAAANGTATTRPADPLPNHISNAEAVRGAESGNRVIAVRAAPVAADRKSDRLWDRIEAFISRLSVRDNFWHSICSFIWLPLAFFSGIRMKRLDANSFSAVLPFRKFNRNWYNAMAGGALLANSEIAGGMYVFGLCGGDYTVVCRELTYKFLRPCLGPAVYKMKPREDITALIATQKEFNLTLDLDISQQPLGSDPKERRVGKCVATFHVTPKLHHKVKKLRKKSAD